MFNTHRILLVEDEEADVVHFQRLCRKHGVDAQITVVRDGDAADIGLDGAEGIVGGFRRRRRRQRVEQGRLADIGQADDPAVKPHRDRTVGW